MRDRIIPAIIATCAILLVTLIWNEFRGKPTPPCSWEGYVLMLHLERQHGIYIDDLQLVTVCKEYWRTDAS